MNLIIGFLCKICINIFLNIYKIEEGRYFKRKRRELEDV